MRSPLVRCWKDLTEFRAAPRLGHPRGNGITPDRVVRGFLVSCGSFCVPVRLDEDESGGVLSVLNDVEPGDAGFPEGGGGIGACGIDEGGDVVGEDSDVDMDDQHRRWGGLRCPLTGRTRRPGQHPGFVPATGSGLDSHQQ